MQLFGFYQPLLLSQLITASVWASPAFGRDRSDAPPLPTRYITANDDYGNSYFYTNISTAVNVTYTFSGDGPPSSESLAYTNDRAPAEISNTTDIDEYKTILLDPPTSLYREDGGANVWFIDMAPLSTSPLHRTISIDYVVQVLGSTTLQTSNNDTRVLNTGDMVINRAVLHKWTNESPTEWSRLMAVITTVQPVVTKYNGTLNTTIPI